MASQADKYTGCLLGLAIGDALGLPWTGLSREEITRQGGGRKFAPARGAIEVIVPVAELGVSEAGEPLGPGQWAENTQLTLALANALIEEGGLFIPESWAHNLVRWLNAGPRAPGISALQAAIQLRTGAVEWDEAADPEGAGCGAACRVAPIALLYAQDTINRRRNAVVQAQVTHGHPDAQAAALTVAEAIATVLPIAPEMLSTWNGTDFLVALAEVVRETSPDFAEFARCLELAQTLLADRVKPARAIRVLGVSAWSREAVPCALYCVAQNPGNFETLLYQAVHRTGGATDSIAAIAGAIGGALHGVDRIPARWRVRVEDTDRLMETADRLYALSRP